MTDLGDHLGRLPVHDHGPDFWAALDAALSDTGPAEGTERPLVQHRPPASEGRSIDVEAEPVLVGSGTKALRWTAAAVAAAAAVVALILGLSSLDDDSAPVDTVNSSTTTTTPGSSPAPNVLSRPAPLVPATSVTEFASPPGYAAPRSVTTEVGNAKADYWIHWFGSSEDPGDPFRNGDLVLVSFPKRDVNTFAVGLDAYDDYVHLQRAVRRANGPDERRDVALLSRTFADEALQALLDSITVDGDDILFAPPDGYTEVAASSGNNPNGPVYDHNSTWSIYSPLYGAATSWWTQGDVDGGGALGAEVRVWASAGPLTPLSVTTWFAIDSEDVDVAGRPGILGTYIGSKPWVLTYREASGTLVMLGTDDPSLDLVAMANSRADPDKPAERPSFPPLVHSEANPALEGTDMGLRWSVFPQQRGVSVNVCFAHGPLGGEEAATHCAAGGVVDDWGVQRWNPYVTAEPDPDHAPPWGMIEYEGEYWMTYAGRAPDCVTTIEVTDALAQRRVETETIEADDGHRWFFLAVPMAVAGTDADDIRTHAVLRGLDADGDFVDAGGDGWSVHC